MSVAHVRCGTAYATERMAASAGLDRFSTGRSQNSRFVGTTDIVSRIVDRFLVGGQLRYQTTDAKRASLRKGLTGAIALQFEHPQATFTSTMTSNGKLFAQCARKVSHFDRPGSNNVGLAAAIELDAMSGKTDLSLGAQFLLPNTKSKVSMSMTGTGDVRVCVRERLSDWMVLRMTSEINNGNAQEWDYKFGLGIQIGPSVPKKDEPYPPLAPHFPFPGKKGTPMNFGWRK